MKVRAKHGVYGAYRELEVTLESGEKLNEGKMSWLDGVGHDALIRLKTTSYSEDKVVLHYDLSGLRTLHSALLVPRSSRRLVGMLAELMRAIAGCVQAGNDYRSMLFDSKTVFVHRDGTLRFVYVPTDRVRFRSQNSPIAFIAFVARSQRRWVTLPGKRSLSSMLSCYINESKRVFSYEEFRRFLKREVMPVWMASKLEVYTESLVPALRLSCGLSAPPVQRTRVVSFSSGDAAGVRGALGLRRSSDRSERLLPNGELVRVGRGGGCDILLADNGAVSRTHAELIARDGQVLVRDLGSTNGTRVRGERIEPKTWVALEDGDEVSFATARFVLARL